MEVGSLVFCLHASVYMTSHLLLKEGGTGAQFGSAALERFKAELLLIPI